MLIKIKFILLFSLLVLIAGCQSQNNNVKSDAEEIYTSIKTNYTDNIHDDSFKENAENFKSTYASNINDYKSDRELIISIENLINSYNLYYVSTGLGNEDAAKQYEEWIVEEIDNLDETFEN